MARGGGVPVGLDGDGQAEELRNVEKKLARGLVGGEDERRRGLRVEVARRQATAGGGVAERRGKRSAALSFGSSARRRLRGNRSSLRETTGTAARQRRNGRARRRRAAAWRAEGHRGRVSPARGAREGRLEQNQGRGGSLAGARRTWPVARDGAVLDVRRRANAVRKREW